MTDDFYSLFNRTPDPTAKATIPPPSAPPGNTHSYAAAALRGEAADVAEHPQGGRNQRLNLAWYNMGRHIGAGSIDIETVRTELTVAARASGLPDHEITTVLRDGPTSAAHNGAQHPRHPTPHTPAPELAVLTNPDNGEPLLNPILNWHELWDKEDDEEWIVAPILPARRMVAIYSEPKAGKSLLALEIAVAVARRTEIFGRVPDRPRTVLYIDFENDPLQDVRARLDAMGHGPDDLENLKYLSFPQLAKMDNATGGDDLIRHVLGYGCEVVIIDTLSRAVAGDENENDTWLNFYRHSGLALKQNGIACIRLDHSGKDKTKGMRGGSAKASDVDAVWNLTLVGDTVILDCTHNRMPVETKKVVLTRRDEPTLKHEVNGDLYAGTNAKIRELIDTLDALGVPSDATNPECRAALKKAGKRAGNDNLNRAVGQRRIFLTGTSTHSGMVLE